MELIRNLNDREIIEYESLLSSISTVYMNESNDQPVWSLSAEITYMVKFFYNYLAKNDFTEIRFTYKQIWKDECYPQNCFFRLRGRERMYNY